MEKCLNKASKQVLNVRSNGLDLGEQLSKLSLFDILPWKARMIKHFCSFSYSLLRQNRASQLLSCFTKDILPKPNTNLGKYSFRMHGSKLFYFCTFSLAMNKNKDSFSSFISNNILLFYDFCKFFFFPFDSYFLVLLGTSLSFPYPRFYVDSVRFVAQ